MTFDDVARLPTYHRQDIPAEYHDDMGHMNVKWYVHLFSQSVRGFLDAVGYGDEYKRSRGLGNFALAQHIVYLAEVQAGETVAIHSRLLGRSAKRVHLKHFMLNETRGSIAATLETVFSCVDLSIRRTAPWPSEVAARLDDLFAHDAGLAWDPAPCGALEA